MRRVGRRILGSSGHNYGTCLSESSRNHCIESMKVNSMERAGPTDHILFAFDNIDRQSMHAAWGLPGLIEARHRPP